MGLEARCQVTWNGETRTTAVHLDSAVVEVRGRPALKVPFASIRRTSVCDGDLVLEAEAGTLVLSLASAARTWAAKIVSPPSRAKKLGLGPNQRVRIVSVTDPALEAEALSAGAEQVTARALADVLFYGVSAPRDLERLARLKTQIAPDGAIWIVRAKGTAAAVKEAEVMSAAKAAGLVNIKVVAFSETHSADKLVIPVAERDAAGARGGKKATPAKRTAMGMSKTAAPRAATKRASHGE